MREKLLVLYFYIASRSSSQQVSCTFYIASSQQERWRVINKHSGYVERLRGSLSKGTLDIKSPYRHLFYGYSSEYAEMIVGKILVKSWDLGQKFGARSEFEGNLGQCWWVFEARVLLDLWAHFVI